MQPLPCQHPLAGAVRGVKEASAPHSTSDTAPRGCVVPSPPGERHAVGLLGGRHSVSSLCCAQADERNACFP